MDQEKMQKKKKRKKKQDSSKIKLMTKCSE